MSQSVTLMSVVGARPQFIKLAPVARSLRQHHKVVHRIVHTGQHYDDNMSAAFFDELDIPAPDVDLGVRSGSHASQTAAMLTGLESLISEESPSALLTYGDTNSTLAATLAAAKLHVPVAHIEAGLRSFNREMPEEINRLVADHCSDRLYAPTPRAVQNLANENLADRALQSGDVMLDAVQFNRGLSAQKSRVVEELGLASTEFGVVTVHRPANTEPEPLKRMMRALEQAAERLPLVFPVHPRTRAALNQLDAGTTNRLRLVEPLPYLDNLALIDAAKVVMTDSGGVQKEAAFMGTPCLTLRNETEWTETIDIGINVLVGEAGRDLHEALARVLQQDDLFDAEVAREIETHYGSGDAADRIVADCIDWVC